MKSATITHKNCHTCTGYGSRCCRRTRCDLHGHSRLRCAASVSAPGAVSLALDFGVFDGDSPLAEAAWSREERRLFASGWSRNGKGGRT